MNDKLTMTVQEIMDLGFSKWTAYNIYGKQNILWLNVDSIFIIIKDLEQFQYQL